MKIALRIQRPGGSIITMPNPGDAPDTTYHFAPEYPLGPHVAEVTDERHIARFLSIKAYSEMPAVVSEAAPQAMTVIPNDPPVQVVNPADATPPAGTEPPAAPPQVSPALTAAPDPGVAELPEAQAEPTVADLERFDRPTLMKIYEAVKGDRPHAAIKIETLRVRIAERMTEDDEAKAKVAKFIADAEAADAEIA